MSLPVITDSASLGAAVRRVRREQRLTQEELALVAGVGRRFIVDLESGKPTARLGETLAVIRALGGGIAIPRDPEAS